MSLATLLPSLGTLSGYRHLRDSVTDGGGFARLVALEEAKPALLALLHRDIATPMLVVTTSTNRASALADQLQLWAGPATPVLLFPEPDVLPYERIDPNPRLLQRRLAVLHHLTRNAATPAVIITTAASLAQGVPSPDTFSRATLTLTSGKRVNSDQLISHWLRAGYEQVGTVEQPGQFARRGGIIDCFPPNLDEPFRIDLFGDEIESIRTLDPATQRSGTALESVSIAPAREVLGSPWGSPPPSLHLDECALDERSAIEHALQQIESGGKVDHPWFYAPLYSTASLLDYLPSDGVVVLEEPQDLPFAIEELMTEEESLRAEQLEKGSLPPDFPQPYQSWEQLHDRLAARRRVVELLRWGGETDEDLGLNPAPAFGGRLVAFLNQLISVVNKGNRVVVVSQQSQRLAELLRERDIFAVPADDLEALPEPKSVTLIQGALPGGWVLPGKSEEDPALWLLTDAEIFGFTKEQRKQSRRRKAPLENPLRGLSPGDPVVHIEHGIGRFKGTVTMAQQEGVEKEYLLLEYADGGRLYVPTDQVDRVARYIGPGDYAPVLNKLGTQEWEHAKERVRKAAQSHAKELLETMAARQVAQGHSFAPDSYWQQEMEASFPYVETPDQLQAVFDVKADMERKQPMDRLVCGDVGYGKTEVAVRAAFKAVQDGYQVAMLVPTTVLAQQHFQTFSQRLSAFPVKVDVISRFRSDHEQDDIIDKLADGEIDIIIGTHRLLQKDVVLKNPGLVIVDEEQRFGVLHKEHFKQLRQQVDVLTLSATPIPRTLYMALVGVRDMSTMETPPEDRLPVKTYVMDYSDSVIRQAIMREMERGGQVFFVHNRVQTISQQAYQLKQLVPEAEIGVGHGQMPEEALERTMAEFSAGKLDVLVCSTIIESGLDMPNVNTIIINDADKLGLSQLYQLRGRVGRGAHRAYAYLLFQRNKSLTEKAQKRLQAVFEATELGAGYFIAMKDLEIRGAGNLLGTEQSGQVGAVGFDLYCRILASAVEAAKAEAEGRPAPSLEILAAPPQAAINLHLPAFLPEDYVANLDARLELYRRLATATEAESIDDLSEELRDRFGALPTIAGNLLFIATMKLLATKAGIATIVKEEGDSIIIRLHEGLKVNRAPLDKLPGVQPGNNQVRLVALGRPARWQPLLEEVLERMVIG